MSVFTNLFSSLTGWLTVSIMGFMIVMMGYLAYMFVHKMNKHE